MFYRAPGASDEPIFNADVPNISALPKNMKWEFPKIWGTLSGGPYSKDPSTWGTILGSPIFGNPQIKVEGLVGGGEDSGLVSLGL